MLRRTFLAGSSAVGLTATRARAETKTVTLWHVFNLDTDMIYPGMKAFNEAQTDYRVEPRLVPGVQIVTELIRAIATGQPLRAGSQRALFRAARPSRRRYPGRGGR